MIEQTSNVNIDLSSEEALVLFDFLSRINLEDNDDLFKHQAEQKILWSLESKLEKILAEPFKSNYLDILEEARNKVNEQ